MTLAAAPRCAVMVLLKLLWTEGWIKWVKSYYRCVCLKWKKSSIKWTRRETTFSLFKNINVCFSNREYIVPPLQFWLCFSNTAKKMPTYTNCFLIVPTQVNICRLLLQSKSRNPHNRHYTAAQITYTQVVIERSWSVHKLLSCCLHSDRVIGLFYYIKTGQGDFPIQIKTNLTCTLSRIMVVLSFQNTKCLNFP